MFDVKVYRPQLIKALTFLVGAAALYIAHTYPLAAPLVNDALALLGLAGVAAGRPQITQKDPSNG